VEEANESVTEMDWEEFEQELRAFDVQHVQGKGKFAFAFVEGPLVKALRSGDWYVPTIFILTHFSSNTSAQDPS
jgi:midasin